MSRSEVAKIVPIGNGYNEHADISPLDALLQEVKRTAGKIAWLEGVVSRLPLADMFGSDELTEQYETNGGRIGRVNGQAYANAEPGSATERVKWILANQGERKSTQVKRTPGIHPAIQLLLNERKHLVNVSSRCLAIGIKLDNVELTKRQGEQMLQGMLQFAELTGQDLESDAVKNAMAAALDAISRQ